MIESLEPNSRPSWTVDEGDERDVQSAQGKGPWQPGGPRLP